MKNVFRQIIGQVKIQRCWEQVDEQVIWKVLVQVQFDVYNLIDARVKSIINEQAQEEMR